MDFQALMLDRGKELETSLLTFHVIALVYPFDDSANQRVVSKLIKEVQATNPSFQACEIRGGYCTYVIYVWYLCLICWCSCCQNVL